LYEVIRPKEVLSIQGGTALVVEFAADGSTTTAHARRALPPQLGEGSTNSAIS